MARASTPRMSPLAVWWRKGRHPRRGKRCCADGRVIRPGSVQGLIEAETGIGRGRDWVPRRGLIERERGGADPFSLEFGAVRGLDQDGGVQREPAAVTPAGEIGGDLGSEGAVADGETHHPAADPPLHGAECGCIEIGAGMELQRPCGIDREHPVGDAAVQVGVGVERGAEALHETDGAEASRTRRARPDGYGDSARDTMSGNTRDLHEC